MIGRTLSHYTALEEISRGETGIAYKALDLKRNGDVAPTTPSGRSKNFSSTSFFC